MVHCSVFIISAEKIFSNFPRSQTLFSRLRLCCRWSNPLPLASISPSEMTNESLAPNSTPKKSRNRDKKNPYSERGLDKFSALLTDLKARKQKIYSENDPENIVLLRFAYKNSDECVPVVVKQRDKKEGKSAIVNVKDRRITNSEDSMKLSIKPSTSGTETKLSRLQTQKTVEEKSNSNRWSKPSYYLTAIVIFILLMLSGFGRSATILCTSLVWYLVPIIKKSSKSRSPTKMKEYARISTQNKMAKNSSDGIKHQSPSVHGHRKSW